MKLYSIDLRGLEEGREMSRRGTFDRFKVAAVAAAAEHQGGSRHAS